jgi:hypothetical protein
LERDSRGYICTGRDLTTWKLDRHPFPLETSLPGVFCAGDVLFNPPAATQFAMRGARPTPAHCWLSAALFIRLTKDTRAANARPSRKLARLLLGL